MNKKWIIAITAVVIVGACILVGSRMARQAAQAQAAAVGETVTAVIGDLSASATAAGQLRPYREATLSLSTPGRVQQVKVREGDVVEAGDTLLQLDTTTLALNVTNAEQNLRLKEANLAALQEPANELDIAAAEAAVASAQANLADLMAGPSAEELAAYEATLRQSQASLASASASLGTAQNSVTESQILAAQAALTAAQLQQQAAQEANEENTNEQTHQALLQANQAVADAQAQLDSLQAGPDVSAAQGSVGAASARLAGAQANFNLQTGSANAAQIASAEAQVAQAEATLADLQAGATAEELAIAEAEVEQARLNLQDAQDALAEATVVAPFAGVVTAVHFNEGEFASGPVVEMVDNSQFKVILEVDEVDIGNLHVGQPATITLETWPDVEIPGEITAIAPSAASQTGSNLVIYEVHIGLEESELPIRVGMTANASLLTNEVKDVLLVPNQAINVDRDMGTYTVNLVVGEGTEETAVQETAVTIGLRDNRYTQILSGLQEGDELLITNDAPVGDVFAPEN
jgi:HlyD family secretion protein